MTGAFGNTGCAWYVRLEKGLLVEVRDLLRRKEKGRRVRAEWKEACVPGTGDIVYRGSKDDRRHELYSIWLEREVGDR